VLLNEERAHDALANASSATRATVSTGNGALTLLQGAVLLRAHGRDLREGQKRVRTQENVDKKV
jgi:hypothetical protein